MRTFIFIVCCCILCLTINAQYLQPSRALSAGGAGEDTASAVAVDHQGNVYVGGAFKSASFSVGTVSLSNAGINTSDAFLAKLDTLGNVIWARRFGNAGAENITALATDAGGFVYAIGMGFPLAKLDNNGNIVWQQTSGADAYTTVAVDSKGNVYTGNYAGFRKYRSDGTFGYAKTVPYYIASGDFSLDRNDFAHIFFHASGGTIVNGTQSYNVNLATKVVYDTSGQIFSVASLSTNPRWYPVGYKAVSANDYYATASYPTLTPIWYMGLGRNITGSNWGYGDCYYKRPVNPVVDGFGNEFYAGNLRASTPCLGTPVFSIGSTNQINTVTGDDIFYIQRNSIRDSGSSTYLSGRTNESAVRMTIDSVRKLIYIAGYWSKIVDTAKFRFGNSVWANAGNGTTNDALLLTFRYADANLTVNAGFDQAVCLGGSVQLSVLASGGAGGYTYSWSPATGLSNANIPNPVAHPSVTTNYAVTVTDAAGISATDTVQVIINPALYKPTISVAVGTNPFCEGQQVILVSSGATSYQWLSQTVTTGLNNNGLALAKSDTVTVTTVASNGCIGTSEPYIVTMKPRPQTPSITPVGNSQGVVASCVGNTVSLTAQSTQAGISFLWSTGATAPSISTQTSGNFSVSATGANGCASLSAVRSVVFYNPPAGTMAANGSTVICSGDSVQLTVNAADTVSVVWSTGATTKSIWAKTAGIYTAQLTTAQGCTRSVSNSIAVQVNQKPVPSITQNGNTLSATPASSYQWYLNNAALAGATAQTLNITAGGSYKVVVVDANGCSGTASFDAVWRVTNPVLTYQVYPNPAKDNLTIVYSLSQSDRVSLSIRNSQGQKIYTVVDNQQQAPGAHQYTISGDLQAKGLVVIEFVIGSKIVAHKHIVL